MRIADIPAVGTLQLEYLVLDLNGTLTDRGTLIDGVEERLHQLNGSLEIHLVTADTFGTAREIADRLGASLKSISRGAEKAAFVGDLGAASTVAIGNGRNDEAMLRAAALGIAVLGPEGAAARALLAADVVCRSITDALDLLIDGRALVATLRA